MESVLSSAPGRATAGRIAAGACALLLPVLTACTDTAPAASRPQSERPAVPTACCQPSQEAAGSAGQALTQTSAPRLPAADHAPARGALPDRQHQVSDLVPTVLAHDYVLARLTYRYDDPTGYAQALTAPVYTTAAFTARSRPTAAELARVRLAQEVSTVRVLTAQVDGEAPHGGHPVRRRDVPEHPGLPRRRQRPAAAAGLDVAAASRPHRPVAGRRGTRHQLSPPLPRTTEQEPLCRPPCCCQPAPPWSRSRSWP